MPVQSRNVSIQGVNVGKSFNVEYPYLEKLLSEILDPAELPGTAGPGVLLEADQLVLDLLSVQTCHPHWL